MNLCRYQRWVLALITVAATAAAVAIHPAKMLIAGTVVGWVLTAMLYCRDAVLQQFTAVEHRLTAAIADVEVRVADCIDSGVADIHIAVFQAGRHALPDRPEDIGVARLRSL